MIVKADAYTIFVGLIGSDLVAQTAFEKDDLAAFRRVADKHLVLVSMFGQARRGRHEFAEPWILELDAGAARRSADVVGAADK